MALQQTKVIQQRIVWLAVIGVLFTCILAISLLSISYYLESREHIQQKLLLLTSNKAISIEHLLYRFEQESKSISGRIHARHLLAQYNRGEINQANVEEKSIGIIREAVRQVPGILGVTRIARNGDRVLEVGHGIPNGIIDPEIVSKNVENIQFGQVITLNDRVQALIVYSPILSHKKHYLGVDVVVMRTDKLLELLQPNKLRVATVLTTVYLSNGNTRLDTSQTESNNNEDDELIRDMVLNLAKESNKDYILSSDERSNIYALVNIKNCDWFLASKVNRAELYRPLLNQMSVVLAIAIAIVSLGAIVMHRLMKPLSSKVVEPAEQSRLESERKYKALFESAGDSIFIIQQERIIDCNQKTLEVFQCTRDEFIEKTLKDFSPEKQPDGRDSKEKAIELIAKAHQGETQFFEWLCCRPDNTLFPVEVNLSRIEVGDSFLLQVILRDISERKRAEETIYHMAFHDALTGLVNRHEFEKRLSNVLDSFAGRKSEHAVLYIDLDQFKVINDSCGHAAGDELLKQIASLLHKPVRERDTVARLGGDEFGILLENCPSSSAMEIANKIVILVREFRFVWKEKIFSVGASIGISEINDVNQTVGEILKTADMACYMSKELGRNRVHMFKPDDKELLQRESAMSVVSQVHEALEHDKFLLYSQTIISLKNEKTDESFHEIFVRMKNKAGDIIPASEFVIAAELYNLMPTIDRWVIRNILPYIAESNFHSSADNKTIFFINLSGTSFNDESFFTFVEDELNKVKFDPGMICFEVTETAAIANIERVQKFIHTIKSIGCHFALDDFGSGLSSFTYLKELPVDYLKIDGAFIQDIVSDHKDYSIVETIAQAGRSLGMQTIAEFVENEEIIEKLKKIGVDYGQGFGIDMPQPLTIKVDN